MHVQRVAPGTGDHVKSLERLRYKVTIQALAGTGSQPPTAPS